MEQLTDITLLKEVKEGNSFAFRCLFHKYYRPLYLFSHKFVDEETAKDIVQDCFLEIWNKRAKIEITSSFSAWVFIVVKHKCLKYLKKESKKNIRQSYFINLLKEEELAFFIDSEKSIFEFDVKDRIQKVLEFLPGKCNLIFCESRINGLSNNDIADKYNISVKSVEKHISKALKMFKSEFQEYSALFLNLFLFNLL